MAGGPACAVIGPSDKFDPFYFVRESRDED